MDYCSFFFLGEFVFCFFVVGVFFEDIYQGGIDLFLVVFFFSYIFEYVIYFGGNNFEFILSVFVVDDLLYFIGIIFSD